MEEMNHIKEDSDEEEHDEEEQKPIDKLGFGVSAYISFLEKLFYIFIVLSVFGAAIMYSFYKSSDTFNGKSIVAKYSMGNIGFV